MGFRFDMRDKTPQQQAIVRSHDKSEELNKKENEKKKEKESTKVEDNRVYYIEEGNPINNTKYCKVWKRVLLEMKQGGFAALEVITVKEFDTQEIRFAYYKQDDFDLEKFKMIPRPLDLPIEDLNLLLKIAKKKKFI